jgi:hypothetical protein
LVDALVLPHGYEFVLVLRKGRQREKIEPWARWQIRVCTARAMLVGVWTRLRYRLA